jgi:hypothetical protein
VRRLRPARLRSVVVPRGIFSRPISWVAAQLISTLRSIRSPLPPPSLRTAAASASLPPPPLLPRPPQDHNPRAPDLGTAAEIVTTSASTGRHAWVSNLSPLPSDHPMTPPREPGTADLQSHGSEGRRSPHISAQSPPMAVTGQAGGADGSRQVLSGQLSSESGGRGGAEAATEAG